MTTPTVKEIIPTRETEVHSPHGYTFHCKNAFYGSTICTSECDCCEKLFNQNEMKYDHDHTNS